MVEAYHTFASPKVEDLYIGGCIDKLISSCSIVSDHHIVAADFILDIPSVPAPHGQTVAKFKWEKISNILVDPVYEREDESIPTTIAPRWNTPHTDNWKENWQLFQDIQKLAGEGSESDISFADKFTLDMELLQDELIQASRQISKEDQKNGHLIPRKAYYKEKLDAAFRLFRSGLEDIATKLKLKGTHSPLEKMAHFLASNESSEPWRRLLNA